MAHVHGGHEPTVPRRIRRILAAVAGGLAVVTAIGVVALWPDTGQLNDVRAASAEGGFFASDVYSATVVDVAGPAPCGVAEDSVVPEGGEFEIPPCVAVTYRIDAGPDAGEERTQEFTVDDPDTPRNEGVTTPVFSEGDGIVVGFIEDAEEGFDYQYLDRQRRGSLLFLVVVFSLVVIALGAFRGFLALIGLAASLLVVLGFVLPSILTGNSPVLVAVVGSAAVAFAALYIAHGFTPLTTVALLGTMASLVLVVVLSIIFTELGQFSGFISEEALSLSSIIENAGSEITIDARGLLLAGAVIGALGALDDMTVTQASAVAELRAADPDMSRRRVARSAMRIGRDHVASTVNTLALAYAGAAMPLLILFILSSQSLGTVANNEIVASEILRTLVGSVGLVASVPITTWLATLVIPPGVDATPPADTSTSRRQRREAGRRRRRGQRGYQEVDVPDAPDVSSPDEPRADETEEDFWGDRLGP